ncbi:hypothetical protein IJD15_04875 [bacterium]|nr:hypothetical protein [bacterium]
MKRFLALFACFIFMVVPSFAKETKEVNLVDDIALQKHISDIGLKLLNANQIDVRMIFVYKDNESKIKLEPGLMKRQIFVYDQTLQFASNDDELAAYIAREISKSAESYSGGFRGFVTSFQVKAAPKKYERFFDKRAVDFMVKAGYNPLGMITYLNKSQPQKRYDTISRHNLTSKRLANIYEYIYIKHPYYLKNNEYIENEAYQNFLLTSIENRKKLHEKIKSGSTKAVKYE